MIRTVYRTVLKFLAMKKFIFGLFFLYLIFVVFTFLSTAKPITREEAVQQVIQSVREFVGPVAAFKTAVIVPSLPKVRETSASHFLF